MTPITLLAVYILLGLVTFFLMCVFYQKIKK